jgi:CubicO group peptidase (beta-lactamase class C family)
MSTRRLLLTALLSAMPALSACGGTDAPPARKPLASAALKAVVANPGVPREALARRIDALFADEKAGETRALLVLHGGRIVAERYGPGYHENTRFAGWSMAKSVTGVLIGLLVSDGRLQLDGDLPVPAWQRPGDPRGEITLRQLLSYTAGQGGLIGMSDLLQDSGMTLAESAARIAGRPQADPPGAVFRYGGPSFQVVGALVEQATGQRWADLFEARIARPLGMTSTTWGHPLRPDLDPSSVRNPNLQGGVYTTAADYGRFLGMVAGRGVLDGRRVLSKTAVAELETVQTAGKPMAYRPPGMSDIDAYDLGNWCEVTGADGACVLASSPGAFGVYPWIDRRTGLYGLFFLRYQLPLVVDPIREARALILSAAP